MLNYFELACFVYSVKWHLICAGHRQDKPCSYKIPQTADVLELTEPETLPWLNDITQMGKLPLLSPRNPLAPFSFWVVSSCCL